MSNSLINEIPFMKIQPLERVKFYQILNNIADRLRLKDTDGSFTKRYLQNDKIPFILNSQYHCKAVFIKSFRNPKQFINFPKIDEQDSKILTIHVTQGILSITDGSHVETIHAPATYKINTLITKIHANVEVKPTNFTIIIHTKQQNVINNIFVHKPIKHYGPPRIVIDGVKITTLPENIKPIPKSKNKLPISYIRTKLTQKEIMEKIIFLDAEFVQSNKKLVPATVTMINIDGKVVFNRIIKPTEKVTDHISFITGLSEKTLSTGMPEKQALELVHKILEGKILVGSDLSQDITVLKINTEKLLGIRDLSTCKTLRKKMNIYDNKISLSKMVYHFWKIELHNGVHTSLEDAKYIREVYLQIADSYEDDFYEDNEILKEQLEVIEEIEEDDVESYGTPLMDENNYDLDDEIEPMDAVESQEKCLQIKSTVKVIEKLHPNPTIILQIPSNITTKDGKILKPKFIYYTDIDEIEINKEQTILKYIPDELK